MGYKHIYYSTYFTIKNMYLVYHTVHAQCYIHISFSVENGPLNVLSIPGWEWSGSSHYLQNALMVMRLTQPLTTKS